MASTMTSSAPAEIGKRRYKAHLRNLQIELAKLQRHLAATGHKLVIVVEGRDAAGKDGVIRRIVRRLSPRQIRVVALGKPSEREQGSWYFQRFASHLPAPGELVLFNRSWYNRAGVERVMGFCTQREYDEFMATVTHFEQMVVGSGVQLIKYYLDISREEQVKRLEERRLDPLKQWKIGPIDARAVELWDEYTAARDEILARTSHATGPWTVVRADCKRRARLNLIRDLLVRVDYDGKSADLEPPDAQDVFRFDRAGGASALLAR